MEGLTLQERFNQFLSFLKDPQGHPHPKIKLEDFDVHLGHLRETPRAHAVAVHEFLQIAIDIMESGMISRQGYLKGNRRTPDIPIHQLESFVLNAAVNVQLAKWVIAKSSHVYDLFQGYGLFPGHLPLVTPDEIIEDFDNMMRGFNRLTYGLLRSGQIHPSRPRTIANILVQLLPNNLNKHREEAMIFDLVNELIFIFLTDIPEPREVLPDNLIASHIFNFISKRKNSTLKGVCLPGQDAIRKRVEYLREKLSITPTI